MNALAALVSCAAGLFLQTFTPDVGAPLSGHQLVDNERVTVSQLNGFQDPHPSPDFDMVEIVYARNQGAAFFIPKATKIVASSSFRPQGTVQIVLKNHAVAPLPNTTGYPNAFPRPGIKKLIENDRVIVWDYTWMPNAPTPMHFHDKDVVVVYLDDGALQSTTPDGKKVVNRYSYGFTKFNPRDRTHTELLVEGHQHAIMMELK